MADEPIKYYPEIPLTDEQRARLEVELQNTVYDGLKVDDAYNLLHVGEIVSTTTQRPVPLSLAAILGGLSDSTAAKLATNPNVLDLRDKILQQDRAGVGLWVMLFAKAGVIAPDEAVLVNGLLAATEDVVTTDQNSPRIATAFPGKLGVSMPNKIEMEDFAKAWQKVRP